MPATHKPLDIEQIESAMPFGKASYFGTIDSTNNWLLEQGQCGDICISEKQSAGRGRRGNTWGSPDAGNIYFSLCWCFDVLPEHLSLLGLEIGITIAEALEKIGLNGHGIKWPNDIFWQQRKLGGILIETVDQSGKVIIGIGLNINMPIEENEKINQEIITLAEAMNGKLFSREQLVIVLIRQLHQHLNLFAALSFNEFIKTWNAWDILQGQVVSFNHQGSEIVGKVVALDPSGRIGILSSTGKIDFFSSADIKLAKLNAD